jgi:hypothetical protein
VAVTGCLTTMGSTGSDPARGGLVPNDYYDFNPSAATWALMLTVVVLFTVGLCVLLIVAISRSEASTVRAVEQPDDESVPSGAPAKRTGSGGARTVTTA